MLLSTSTEMYALKAGDKEAIRMISESGFDAYDYTFFIYKTESNILADGFIEYYSDLRKYADMLDIVCNQAHAPYPSSVGNEITDAEIYDRIVRSIEAASILGANIIIVHPKQHLKYAEHPDELFEMNVAFYKSLIPYCEKFGIKVAVENMFQFNKAGQCITDSTCSRAWEFCKYIDAIDSEWVVGCFDIGHAALVDADIPEFIHTLGNKRLQALHVHDNDLGHDSHTLPYTMKIDYNAVTKALKDIDYKGDFTYETRNFIKSFPFELYPDASLFMCKVGRHLIKLIKD